MSAGGGEPFSLIHPTQAGPPFGRQRKTSTLLIAMKKQYMRSHIKEASSNLEGYKRLP